MKMMANRFKTTKRLMGCASALAIATQLAGPGFAQEALPADDLAAEEEVVVTATRVQRSGFVAPTPTTVLNAQTLEKLIATDIGSALGKMPSFQTDQNVSTNPLGGGAGRRYANLRNLGSQRTLVLVDGQRVAPSALTGQTDLNGIPMIMLERVDVVTGGASAQWGSDAVAGVVNMITKKNVDTTNVDVSFGISDRNDNLEHRIAVVTGGSFDEERGRVVLGGEYVNNDGVEDMYSRSWGREEWGIVTNTGYGTNGLARTLILPNVRRNLIAPGGLIVTGPLAGTTFDENGEPRQFVYGSVNGGAGGSMSGGEGYAGSDGQGTPLKPGTERVAAHMRVGYDITPDIELFAKASYNYLDVSSLGPGPLDYSGTGLTIRQDNAYMSETLRDVMIANNIQSFSLARYWKDEINGSYRRSRPATSIVTEGGAFTLGGEGSIDDTWSFDVYAQFATNLQEFNGYGYRVNPNFRLATDAVVGPNGSIVCRSTLANPGNGCVPINLFGVNSVSDAAFDYVTADQYTRTRFTRTVQAANISGEPFENWAGPVSIAFGVEHRLDKASLENTDVLALTNAYNYGNTKPVGGSIEVTEGYFETVIPLLNDLDWAKNLEFNGAVRMTNYSTSGNVTTWKTGLNYAVNDMVRFRGSVSRDIRAANVSELYTAESRGSANIINPANSGNLTGTTISSGNPDLVPEESMTYTAGVVFTPDFAPGLKVSLDYYDIEIEDVISTVNAQAIVDFCYDGAQDFCDLIEYTSPETANIRVPFLNLAGLRVKGWDLETSYALDLADLFADAPGSLSFTYFLTYQSDIIVNNGTSTTNRAGDMGNTSAPYGGPKWKWNLLTTYSIDQFATTFGVRYVGGGSYNVTYAPDTISDNSIDSATYLSLSASYDFDAGDDNWVQVYGTIDNLSDLDPRVIPLSTVGGPYNATFHDVVGRTYMVGMRASF